MIGLFKKALSVLGLGDASSDADKTGPAVDEQAPPPVKLSVLVACGSDFEGGMAWVEKVAGELDLGVQALGLSDHIIIQPSPKPIWDPDPTADPNDINAMMNGVSQTLGPMNGHFAVMLHSNPFEDQIDVDFVSGQFKYDFATLALAGRHVVRVPMEAEDRPALMGLLLASALPILDSFHPLSLAVLPPAVEAMDEVLKRDSALFELIDRRNFEWMNANAIGHIGGLKADAEKLEQSRVVLKSLFEDGYEGVNEDAIRLRLGMDLVTTQTNLAGAKRDNEGYKTALSLIEQTVELIGEQTQPDDRIRAKNLHFRMLLAVGRLDHDAARLSEAIAAGRELLDETEREHEPLQWVARCLDLVDAELALSNERPSKTGLESAVNLLAEAAEEEALENTPQLKFDTLDLLAKTHFQRGTLDPQADHVAAEITVLEAMVELVNKTEAPDMWARVQNSLGDAYLSLYRFDGNLDSLDRGIAALQRASTSLSKDPNPEAWANMYLQLGTALKVRGDIKSQDFDLRAAVRAIEDALRVFKREEHPEQWANCQFYLGVTLYLRAAVGYSPTTLDAASAALSNAAEIFTREKGPRRWAEVKDGEGRTLILKGEFLGQKALVRYGLRALDEALEVRTPERDFGAWVVSSKHRANGLFIQAYQGTKREYFEEAISAFRMLADHESDKVYDAERGPLWHDLGTLHFVMYQRRLDDQGVTLAKDAWAKARDCYERAGMVEALKRLDQSEAEVSFTSGDGLKGFTLR